jgi:hypothetical protein
MNYSKKVNAERNCGDIRKRIMDYLKSGPTTPKLVVSAPT